MEIGEIASRRDLRELELPFNSPACPSLRDPLECLNAGVPGEAALHASGAESLADVLYGIGQRDKR